MISFVVTPFMLLFNVIGYLRTLGLPEPSFAALNAPLATTNVAKGENRSLKFKMIYGVVIWAIVIVCALNDAPKLLERYSPKLNAYLHSGIPTTDADFDYRVAHLTKAAQSYQTLVGGACPENATFKECRAKILAARPVLDDMKTQYQALSTGWAKVG